MEAVPDRQPADDASAAALEEAAWVAAARGGDQGAFDRLVQRYQKRAVAVAYRLLGSVHDASDVAQDAFLRAYRKLGSLEDAQRFGPWVLRIVTNLSLNFRRSRSRQAASGLEQMEVNPQTLRMPAGGTFVEESSAGEEIDAEHLEGRVKKAIASLPEKQRTALVLFSMEGLPQKEVAEIMGCTVELVKWNVFQARKAMKKALADLIE